MDGLSSRGFGIGTDAPLSCYEFLRASAMSNHCYRYLSFILKCHLPLQWIPNHPKEAAARAFYRRWRWPICAFWPQNLIRTCRFGTNAC